MNSKDLDIRYDDDVSKITMFCLIIKLILLFYTHNPHSIFNYNFDYYVFLSEWLKDLQANIFTANIDITYRCNYTSPYLSILRFISLFNTKYHLDLIKGFSFVFDFINSFIIYEITLLVTNNLKKAKTAMLITLLFPTFILNSSFAAQCDAIYVCFLLASLWFILNDKYKTSIVCFAISLSFKLQAIFFLPILGILLLQKKYKFKDLFLIPLIFTIMNIPEVIMSKSFKPLLMFLTQAQTDRVFASNTMSILNIITIITGKEVTETLSNPKIIYIGIPIIVITTLIAMFKYKDKVLSKYDIIKITFFFAVFVVFFMPNMHERYYYLAETLLILVLINNPEKNNYNLLLLEVLSFMRYSFFIFIYIFDMYPPAEGLLMLKLYLTIETATMIYLLINTYKILPKNSKRLSV